jgi:PAS domain S-box-containing protein
VAGTSKGLRFEIPRPLLARPEFYVPLTLLAALLALVSVESLRRLRADRRMLRERDARYRAVVETQTEPVWRMTPQGTVTFVNGAFCRFFGVARVGVVGRGIAEYFPALPWEELLTALRRADGEVFEHDMEVNRPMLPQSWFRLLFAGIHDSDGQFVEIQAVAEEITARKVAEDGLTSSLREKEVLLKEIHHRVKNNLQIISSLLSLQAQSLKEPSLRDLFVDSQNRVRSMALIHERLYQSRSLANIAFEEYARELVVHLQRSYSAPGVIASVAPTLILLPIDLAVPLGLILNELVSNALKHAFPGNREGRITITLAPERGDRLVLSVSDDGVGMPEGTEIRGAKTLGLQLIDVLASQIEAQMEIRREKGTMILLSFPMKKEKRV